MLIVAYSFSIGLIDIVICKEFIYLPRIILRDTYPNECGSECQYGVANDASTLQPDESSIKRNSLSYDPKSN